jgi:hypothetical protein
MLVENRVFHITGRTQIEGEFEVLTAVTVKTSAGLESVTSQKM